EYTVQLAGEVVKVAASNAELLLLGLLTFSGGNNKPEDMLANLERCSQTLCTFWIACGPQESHKTLEQRRRGERIGKVLLSIFIQNRLQMESAIIDNPEDGDESVED